MARRSSIVAHARLIAQWVMALEDAGAVPSVLLALSADRGGGVGIHIAYGDGWTPEMAATLFRDAAASIDGGRVEERDYGPTDPRAN